MVAPPPSPAPSPAVAPVADAAPPPPKRARTAATTAGRAAVATGAAVEPLKFFFGSAVAQPGKGLVIRGKEVLDWRSKLSNFAPIPGGMEVDGRTFAMVETYFQGSKALFSTHKGMIDEFVVGPTNKYSTGKAAKRAGGKPHYTKVGAELDVPRWDANCDAVMERGLRARFACDAEFAEILLSTRGRTLLHSTPRPDKHWCGTWKDGEIRGENTLGKLLMKIRDEVPQ